MSDVDNANKILRMAYNEAGDYFSRLGGSGRYQGFSEDHIPTLVLLIALNKIWSIEDVNGLKSLLPSHMWNQTDQLPDKIEAIISGLNIQQFEDMSGFIDFVTGVYQKHPSELKRWEHVLSEIDLFRHHRLSPT